MRADTNMIRRIVKLMAVFMLAEGILIPGFSANADDYRAWISSRLENNTLKIEAFCQAPEDGYVKYALTAAKSGGAGRSNSSQSGRVYLKKGDPRVVSHLRLGLSPGDTLSLQLKVYRQGRLVAEDSLFQ